MTEQTFDKVGDAFVDYYGTVRGYVREQLTRLNLAPFLGEAVLRVADIGGGDGRDAIWLAQQGHSVHLVDPSQNMTDKAKQTVMEHGLAGLVEVECGDPEEVLSKEKRSYDLAVSHGVMMYLDDPLAHLKLLKQLVTKQGIVSVLTKGKSGSIMRLLQKQDYQAASHLAETGRLTNNLGEDVLAVNLNDMQPMLKEVGLKIMEFFGVRIASDSDNRPVNSVGGEELISIIDLEGWLGSEENTKGAGQMLHFICKPVGGNI